VTWSKGCGGLRAGVVKQYSPYLYRQKAYGVQKIIAC
jgi:hypothetical protein